MKITSPSFLDNSPIPSLYSCDGSNISPPLQISDVPENAQSLVVVLDDPDAPSGIFTHWLLWNIDPKTNFIAESLAPQGSVRGTNSMGHINYDGPCPPSGTHHYHFKLYALDSKLNLEIGSSRNELEKAIQDHIIDQTELIGLYSNSTSV